MRIAVIQFPGSNADWDALHAARVVGADAWYVFHKSTRLSPNAGPASGDDPDAVIIPGGFSYGDYLRAGAIAGFSPIVPAIREFAARGGPVLGICNGFQVLTELGLLPGALTRNTHLRFECRDVHIRVEHSGAFTRDVGRCLRVPIAHAEGRYQCDPNTLRSLQEHGQIAFRYVSEDGVSEDDPNPNGSVDDIAGVYNEQKNVLGMMPHPERASETILGGDDGREIFEALRDHLQRSQTQSRAAS